MKKIFAAILFAAMFMLSSSAYSADTATISESSTTASVTITLSVELDYSQWTGSGTESNPYVIASLSDIDLLGRYVAMGYETSGKYFVLKNDITFTNTDTFLPIGTADAPFKGNFDAKGYKISGIKYSGSASYPYGGFFGYVDGGEIKNVILDGCIFSGQADQAMGCLVGYQNSGTITNCAVINSTVINTANYATGGIVGKQKGGTIQYCLFVPASNSGSVSDLTRDQEGTVKSSYTSSNAYVISTDVITDHVTLSLSLEKVDITKTSSLQVSDSFIIFGGKIYVGKDKTITLLVTPEDYYEVTKIDSKATLTNDTKPFKYTVDLSKVKRHRITSAQAITP